jgi:hypothetical protein
LILLKGLLTLDYEKSTISHNFNKLNGHN